jgi:hypothetical protein
MKRKVEPTTYVVEKLLEFDEFFPGEKIDVRETLSQYSRETLLKLVGVLDNRFNGVRLVDDEIAFFSENSKDRIREINKRLDQYRKKNSDGNPFICTRRTVLELLRNIYLIPVEEYKNNGNKDIEYNLFKVILLEASKTGH